MRTKPEIAAAIKDGIDKHALPHLEAGAMTYMMSKQGYLNDAARNWIPHLMFYFPRSAGATWGTDLSGAPPMLNPQFPDSPEALGVIMVPVTHWSDGTPAPAMRRPAIARAEERKQSFELLSAVPIPFLPTAILRSLRRNPRGSPTVGTCVCPGRAVETPGTGKIRAFRPSVSACAREISGSASS
jgi:hypothetical protein